MNRQLVNDLENVRNEMETFLEDVTVKNLPRAYEKIKDTFDEILQKIEGGDYDDSKTD